MSEWKHKKAWANGLRAGVMMLIIGALFFWGKQQDVDSLANRIQQHGALPFFGAMTVLPLTGLPVTPFYLMAGAVFGERFALVATSMSTALHLLLAYGLMRVAPEKLLRRIRERFRKRNAQAPRKQMNPWIMTLLVRATPGPTLAMRNYFLGLSRVPLVPYMAVSWPLSMGYAAGLILLGDSAFEGFAGTPGTWIAGVALLLALSGTVYGLRRWAESRSR